MTDNAADDFFTTRHARLTRIAYFANILAWVILVYHILWVGVHFVKTYDAYTPGGLKSLIVDFSIDPDFIEILVDNPLFAISLVSNLIGLFIRGIVSAIVLKGISLGLYMIVDTDLNYREKAQEGSNA